MAMVNAKIMHQNSHSQASSSMETPTFAQKALRTRLVVPQSNYLCKNMTDPGEEVGAVRGKVLHRKNARGRASWKPILLPRQSADELVDLLLFFLLLLPSLLSTLTRLRTEKQPRISPWTQYYDLRCRLENESVDCTILVPLTCITSSSSFFGISNSSPPSKMSAFKGCFVLFQNLYWTDRANRQAPSRQKWTLAKCWILWYSATYYKLTF